MRGAFGLALRYVLYNRGKTATLVACLTLTGYLPLAVGWLTGRFQTELVARARSTPVLVGTKGSRYDLVLHSLYFEGKPPAAVGMKEVDRIADSGLARPIPLLVRHRAGGQPVVGTTLDYFPFRGLRIESGSILSRIGDCVLGANVAARLDWKPGDHLFTEPENVFDIAGEYPLKLRVVGVLARAHSPDDDAVFVDMKTAWIIEGIGHGHQDVAKVDKSVMIESKDKKLVANAALPKFTEITDENIASFHFHGDPAEFPATAIIAIANDAKSAALLKGRYLDPKESVQVLDPEEVVGELLSVVAKIKRFFDAQSVLVAAATFLLIGLVVVLSVRLRRREMETMFRIGCGRRTIFWLHAWEWGMIATLSGFLVTFLGWATVSYATAAVRAVLF